MSFRTELSEEGKKLSIFVEGKFDFTCRGEFAKLYEGCLDNLSNIGIDLSEVSYIDSAACGMLIILKNKAQNLDVELDSFLINKSVQTVFDIMNLPLLFDLTLVD